MKKNENINCRINPITRTITISKPFAKAAGKVGTAEYDELMRAMKDHPDYAVELRSIKKKEGKKTYTTKVAAEELEFVESKAASQKAGNGQGENTGRQSYGDGFESLGDNEDLPFT